ncbi:MAG TPA: T3SS effector HopA1 family protein [Gemmatimonadota bacterium]|nr:T3SS effector HopA1 family protein [Gemmatimonadota bacterium]
MIPDARSLTREVLTRCVVDPPVGFEWFGRRIDVDGDPADDPREAFLRSLALHLYLHVYCQGNAVERLPTARPCGVGEVRALLTAHSFANPERTRWDTGWTFVGSSRDSYLVRREGIDFSVPTDGIRPVRDDTLRAGREVQVLVPADRWSRSPGFMLFDGRDLLPPRSEGDRRTRLYLDMDEEGARWVIGLCGRFNHEGLPFGLKVAGHPAEYDRCDTVVLFVARDDYPVASRIMVEAAIGAPPRPRPGVPAFTRRLAAGVSVADDPATGESFGESRCRLLAGGILRGHDAGADTIESRMDEVEACFLDEGLTLDRPHLESGSVEYEIGPWALWPTNGPAPGPSSVRP